jgi:hypothetical protein
MATVVGRSWERWRDKLWRREANGYAADTSFVFRVRHQVGGSGGQSADPIVVADVAFKQRQDAHRHSQRQHHFKPGR